jgi:hypothetical protein
MRRIFHYQKCAAWFNPSRQLPPISDLMPVR